MNIEYYFRERAQDIFYPCYEDLARTLGGGNKTHIMSVLFNRNRHFKQKYNKDNYFYLKYSYLQIATGLSPSVVKRTLKALEQQGLIFRETVYEKTGKKDDHPFNRRVYFKINYEILLKAKLEDDNNKHLFVSDYTQYLKNCPTIEMIRSGKTVAGISEKSSDGSNMPLSNPDGSNMTPSDGSNMTPLNNIKEENYIKAVLIRTAPKSDLADARPLLVDSDSVSEIHQEQEEEQESTSPCININVINEQEEQEENNNNHNTPCINQENNNPTNPCNKTDNNIPAETLEEVSNIMAAPAAPVFRATPKLRGADADAFLDSVEQGLNTPLQVDKEPCTKAAREAYFGKDDENKKSHASLFTGTREPKKINTKRELDSIRQSDPAFMRIYDAWVDEGFPAHKPDTVVFKESRKYIKQVLDGTFFVDKMDLDQYARKYSVREIIKSIKNFKLAFNENYEPLNKKWLKSRRSLAKFLFDPTLNSKSLFVEYLEEPALLHPIEKTPEAKYKEKFGVDYVFLPDWLVPHYEKQEETWNFNEDELTEEQKDYGVTFYFMGIMRERDDLFEGCNWGKLPFGWSDWQMFRKMFDEKEKVEAWEYETNPNFYARLKDRFIALRDRVNEMESDMTRGHLFSERIWAMLD